MRVRGGTCRWSRCTACSPWAAQTDPTQAIAVIMQAEDRRFALLVDHLIGQHRWWSESRVNYRKVPGISAATILGDGSVA